VGRRTNLFAKFSPARSEKEGRAFFQRRLALFTKAMFGIFALLVLVNGVYASYPVYRPENASIILCTVLAGLCLLVGFWFVTSRPRALPAWALLGIDIASMAMISTAFTTCGVLAGEEFSNLYTSFMWMGCAVLARSLILPSSAKRTALLSLIGLGPALIAPILVEPADIPSEPLLGATVLFIVGVTIAATIGSQTIYGLRAQVSEVMQLGQYTILEKIGEGGMGTVYRARHTMLRRPTAIKVIKPEQTGRKSLARFEREVQATSELTHPNTVAVYDYGRSPEGRFYCAMEYLDGVDLETLVNQDGAQPWQRVVHVLRQVSGALAEAHERGLIHRDVKPGNIILCNRAGMRDVAKLLDFGLVRDLERDDNLTGSDVIRGTPAYLAPESVTHPEDVDSLSDLYGLGAIGYFMLTGRRVFTGATVVEVCMHHLSTEPTPPSQVTDNDIPRGLEQLVLQCLAKAPPDRPSSARQLEAALTALASTNPWTERQAYDWWDHFQVGPRQSDGDGHGVDADDSDEPLTVTIDIDSRTEVGSDVEPTRPWG